MARLRHTTRPKSFLSALPAAKPSHRRAKPSPGSRNIVSSSALPLWPSRPPLYPKSGGGPLANEHATMLSTTHRSQARTGLGAGQARDSRAQLPNSIAPLWCPLQIRIRRSLSSRLRTPHSALHLRPPCPRVPFPRQGEGKGVLAGQAASGACPRLHIAALRAPPTRPRHTPADPLGPLALAPVVPRILREQGHILFRRPSGGNEAPQARAQGAEAGGADDSVWRSDFFRFRGENKILGARNRG